MELRKKERRDMKAGMKEWYLARRLVFQTVIRAFLLWERLTAVRLVARWRRKASEPKQSQADQAVREECILEIREHFAGQIALERDRSSMAEERSVGLAVRLRQVRFLLLAAVWRGVSHTAHGVTARAVQHWRRGIHDIRVADQWQRERYMAQEGLEIAERERVLLECRAEEAQKRQALLEERCFGSEGQVTSLQSQLEAETMRAAKEKLGWKKENQKAASQAKSLQKRLEIQGRDLELAQAELHEAASTQRGNAQACEVAEESEARMRDAVARLTSALTSEHHEAVALRAHVAPNHLLLNKVHKACGVAHAVLCDERKAPSVIPGLEGGDGFDMVPRTPAQLTERDRKLLMQCDMWLRGIIDATGTPQPRPGPGYAP